MGFKEKEWSQSLLHKLLHLKALCLEHQKVKTVHQNNQTFKPHQEAVICNSIRMMREESNLQMCILPVKIIEIKDLPE